MTEYQKKLDFVIPSPYEFTKTDSEIVNEGINNDLKWSDDHYLDVKKRMRDHLRVHQKNRCAFCRLRIPRSQFYPHLEHIVSKDARDEFTFYPINLVYCCQRCNFGKGTINTLATPDTEIYPQNSIGFVIVNPYHDNFWEYFDLIEDVILIADVNTTSNKGPNTYEFYKLGRIELAEDRAFELKTIFQNLTKEEIIQKLILRLTREEDQRIIEMIKYYLEKIPNWIIE